ncbi:MAG TPA: DUF58 domain-containing protein [Pirellulaceae bacterium]|nr:DUF58 domain-containing protein [Pirellulaceae bacterium]
MPIRRRAWLTREGWYYSAVLAFIVAGAILKSVNLLVVLAGVMIAPLIINWRMVMASLSGLTIRRKLPEQICAGEPLTVEVVVANPRRWMSSWMTTVEDWVERSGSGKQEAGVGSQESEFSRRGRWTWRGLIPRRMFRRQGVRGEAIVTHVPAGGTAIGTYRLTLHRRGRYRFGPLRVSTRFPLGLVSGRFTQPADGELIVAPHIGRMTSQWLELIEAELAGDQQRHPQRGISEGDYYGLRPWQSGDSMRWVHWRTTAKLGRPIVRQFERRRNRDVAIVLDPWRPEPFDERDDGLLELAISLAATAITDLASRGQSRLTFAIAGQRTQCWTGPASPMFCREVLAQLAEVQPTASGRLAVALARASEEAPYGTRLLVISPRSAEAAGKSSGSLELPYAPEDLSWIDVSSDQLDSLYVL